MQLYCMLPDDPFNIREVDKHEARPISSLASILNLPLKAAQAIVNGDTQECTSNRI